MRCFLGLPLSDSYQEKLEMIVKDSKRLLSSRIKWTKKGNWHLTLFFLGEISSDQLHPIRESLKTIEYPSYTLKPGKGGAFPSLYKPRVLWIGLEKGIKQTQELAGYVTNILMEFNLIRDKKRFIPHLTLGRIKKLNNDDWDKWLGYINSLIWEEIKISSFILWQSILTSQGPIYKVIEKYPLI